MLAEISILRLRHGNALQAVYYDEAAERRQEEGYIRQIGGTRRLLKLQSFPKPWDAVKKIELRRVAVRRSHCTGSDGCRQSWS